MFVPFVFLLAACQPTPVEKTTQNTKPTASKPKNQESTRRPKAKRTAKTTPSSIQPKKPQVNIVQLEVEEMLRTAFKSPKDVKVIELWATWCTSCRVIAPDLEKLIKKYPEVTFLQFSADKNLSHLKRYRQKNISAAQQLHLSTWSTDRLKKEYAKVGGKYTGSIPYFMVLDKNNKLQLEITEPSDVTTLDTILAQLSK